MQIQDALIREQLRLYRQQRFMSALEAARVAKALHAEIVEGICPTEKQIWLTG